MHANLAIPAETENSESFAAAVTKVLRAGAFLLCAFFAPAVMAAEAVVAVASNFAETARALAQSYEAESGHRIKISSGATGALYAQIRNGAPFDVFLAANDSEPTRLAAEGHAAGTPYVYALGRLVLWSSDAQRIDGDCATVLKRGDYRRLALANPRLAPYGAAATAVLRHLGLSESLAPRLVTGENVAQTFQYAATGNAELGFVALAQTLALPPTRAGSQCVVEPGMYPPIRQQAVLLKHGADNAAAAAFFDYLRSARAANLIKKAGYALPE